VDRVFGAVIPSEESKEPLRLNSGKLSDPVSGRARRGMVASALHQVVSEPGTCLYISGRKKQRRQEEDRVTEDSVRTCLQVGNSP
jgi:hypothetical protein